MYALYNTKTGNYVKSIGTSAFDNAKIYSETAMLAEVPFLSKDPYTADQLKNLNALANLADNTLGNKAVSIEDSLNWGLNKLSSLLYSATHDIIYNKDIIKGEDLGSLTDDFISMMSSYLNFDVNAYLNDKATYLATFDGPINDELAKKAQEAQNGQNQAPVSSSSTPASSAPASSAPVSSSSTSSTPAQEAQNGQK